MQKKPKVSIIIPVYNGSDYMRCAIDSALSQTYGNLEVIVVNDGSQDEGETERIAQSYGNKICYFSKKNGGVSSALNLGISKMTGDYFSWLSHDDAYYPDKIKDAVALLERYNRIGNKTVAYTGGYISDANGNKIRNFRTVFMANKIYSGKEVVNIMTINGTIYGCCMLIPKTAFEDAGYFDEQLRYSQDSLMWYRIFLNGYELVSDNHPNVVCRMHKNQVSQRRKDLFSHDSLVIAKLLADPLIEADSNGKILFQYIKRLTKHRCSEAVEYLSHYAMQNNRLSIVDSFRIRMNQVLGYFRYWLAIFYKKMLFLFRR